MSSWPSFSPSLQFLAWTSSLETITAHVALHLNWSTCQMTVLREACDLSGHNWSQLFTCATQTRIAQPQPTAVQTISKMWLSAAPSTLPTGSTRTRSTKSSITRCSHTVSQATTTSGRLCWLSFRFAHWKAGLTSCSTSTTRPTTRLLPTSTTH